MHGAPVVLAMPMALIGRLIASVCVVYRDIVSTQHFAVRQSRVGHLWQSLEALLEPFLIKNRSRPTLHEIYTAVLNLVLLSTVVQLYRYHGVVLNLVLQL
jgi:hypothetical protein